MASERQVTLIDEMLEERGLDREYIAEVLDVEAEVEAMDDVTVSDVISGLRDVRAVGGWRR